MNLAQLKKLIETVDTYGFPDDQVEVNFHYTFSKMEITHKNFNVSVDDAPVAKLDLFIEPISLREHA